MKSVERQQQILHCAKQVFADRGYHGANISHICKAAGIGRGTLYQYFANKKAVFEAIVRDCLGNVQALMERQKNPVMPAPESLTRSQILEWTAGQLKRLLETVFQDERTLRILLREAVGLDVDIETLLSEIDDGIISIVEADLIAAQKAGIVRADLSPRLTATLIVGGVEKLALAALRSDATIDLAQMAREATRLHHIGTMSNRVPRDD